MGWIALGILAALLIWAISIYNRLVELKNRFKNAFAQIDVQLKRRYDLIPNLVETAKGYMKFERETLEAVISARNSAQAAIGKAAADPANADAMKALTTAEGTLTGALSRFFALAEAYPDLKANQNMLQLQEELFRRFYAVAREQRGALAVHVDERCGVLSGYVAHDLGVLVV